MVEFGQQMACFGPSREIGPVCPRATGGPRTQQVVPLSKINLSGGDDLSGRDGTASGLLWTLLEIGPAPCGEMEALVAPGSLSEGSHSDGSSLGREMS